MISNSFTHDRMRLPACDIASFMVLLPVTLIDKPVSGRSREIVTHGVDVHDG